MLNIPKSQNNAKGDQIQYNEHVLTGQINISGFPNQDVLSEKQNIDQQLMRCSVPLSVNDIYFYTCV